MKTRLACIMGCATAAMTAFANFDIELDIKAAPIRDVRTSTCGPVIGYAGSVQSIASSIGGDTFWTVTNKMEMSRACREAGAWLQRVWSAEEWFAHGGENPYDPNSTDPKEVKRYKSFKKTDPLNMFKFWKDNDIKVLLTIEAWGGERAKKRIIDLVDFIVSNKFESVVAGFELGNETYFARPENVDGLCKNWNEIIPEIKKRMPKVNLGIPICELFENNPDLTQVRNRMLEAGEIKRDTYFAAGYFNQTSARMIINLKPSMDMITHVIYHAYGTETPYSCTYYGMQRFRNFAEAFPEIKGKKYWLTEIRPRSDEDDRCQRLFRESLIMSHYALTMICQPDVDGYNHHQLYEIAGGLYISSGKGWPVQWRDGGGDYPDYRAPYNLPRLEVGSMGVAYRIYTEAIKQHPLVLAHGTLKEANTEDTFFTSARVADEVYAHRRALKEGRKPPKVKGEVEWTALANANRNQICFLMVNSKQTPETIKVSIPGKQFAAPTYVTLSCPEKFLDRRDVPGDGKAWSQLSWEDTQTGYDIIGMEPYVGMKPYCDTMTITIEPNTIQSVTVVVRNTPQPKK
ncbi:MAG: hypothetical protein IJT64_04665 [Kiritimatiellae bacterium]|nr:hypothetical protein [Kiritimatiellia bacterium]